MRNHCNTLSRLTYTGGRQRSIAELIREGSHRLESWGNSREGFTLYLTAGDSTGVQISSGAYTCLGDLKAAAERAYSGTDGFQVRVHRGRNW